MSLAAACALLGLKLWERGEPPGREGPWVQKARDGRVRVIFDHSPTRQREYNVSRAAFDLAALLELRGVQALDWPCEECEGSKWVTVYVRGDGGYSMPDEEPCPACTIDGKPTGRRKVAAFEAVLMGEPRTWTQTARATTTLTASRDLVDICENTGAHMLDEPRRIDDGLGGLVELSVRLCRPGHEGARAALRQLAEGWEHLAEGMPERSAEVMLDRAEARGDASARGLLFAYPPGGQPHAAPCPELGAWVLAWLAGEIECEPCARATPGGPSVRGCPHPHPGTSRVAVDAHLEAIRAHLAEAWQGATVECGDCYGIGGWEHPTTPVLDPCTACAGLGRVKPQPEAA